MRRARARSARALLRLTPGAARVTGVSAPKRLLPPRRCARSARAPLRLPGITCQPFSLRAKGSLNASSDLGLNADLRSKRRNSALTGRGAEGRAGVVFGAPSAEAGPRRALSAGITCQPFSLRAKGSLNASSDLGLNAGKRSTKLYACEEQEPEARARSAEAASRRAPRDRGERVEETVAASLCPKRATRPEGRVQRVERNETHAENTS